MYLLPPALLPVMLAVEISSDATPCSASGTLCSASMAPSCGLYYTGDPDSQCSRLYSPSLKYVLVLQRTANLALYQHDPVTGQLGQEVWATNTNAGVAVSLTVGYGSWRIFALAVPWPKSIYSDEYGTEYSSEGGSELWPFKMQVGDDGMVRVVNREGRVAWVSSPSQGNEPSPSTDTSSPPVDLDDSGLEEMPGLAWSPPPSPGYGPNGNGGYGYGTYPPSYGFSPPPPMAPVYSPPPLMAGTPAGPPTGGRLC